ncbi:hypothetical protein [bacterium endosymbiont of Bathymodiolus sp. 5 South]|uniref:hypothetical protein n=1 Tax=bacterium endosymbiont of Bathymodiolus sp. 5 South TaxID=1181670 RepID=UPI0010BBD422|nr:hypothetical protein [bacterium endosymbiont of Bathymodiolus sp. 5 South]SHN94022.1 Low molecular weight protein tyrosine phosphatase [bacterium endosymbiont of Bathymodiolus sp. 5 South]SSC08383.1 Low molecular weight protein tyrosine phosphatase [bacterium endosymbiont of Bathymodiolus sp. 5 South]VVH55318.1 Low molecular weight protein tyrosine phosphatase (EC [uncultured Gammaproteobacteria bacterium]VVH63844.1 Low molecular weight protein tyrosine phosphatase (EC [uncultured Gammaprote
MGKNWILLIIPIYAKVSIKIRLSFARTHNFLLTASDKLTLNNSQILSRPLKTTQQIDL